MLRAFIFLLIVLLGSSLALGRIQPDKLEGRWSGAVDGFQGQQPSVATFKKEGDKYSGAISGLRPGADIPIKDIVIDGDKVTGKTEVETPQGNVVVNYAFVVQGESLKGKAETEYGGQTYTFNFDLKRGGQMPAGAAPATQAQQPPPRREVPQPQQKQSLYYFVGEWSFNWIGRESALGPAPREGTATFTLRADGKSLDVRTVGKSDSKPFTESAVVTWDEETKTLTFVERLAGIQLQSKGDWHSPISIRFTIDPIRVKGQTLQLKRIISVVAAHSFTVTEELSENGGPFVRLGSAVYTKVATTKR